MSESLLLGAMVLSQGYPVVIPEDSFLKLGQSESDPLLLRSIGGPALGAPSVEVVPAYRPRVISFWSPPHTLPLPSVFCPLWPDQISDKDEAELTADSLLAKLNLLEMFLNSMQNI